MSDHRETTHSGPITMRRASREDVPAIVAMLAHDPLGAQRERYEEPLGPAYYQAFEAIDRSAHEHLMVAEQDGMVIGVLQLSILQYLTYQGGKRALIEGVRVHESARGKGLGRQMFEWAIARARDLGCHVVQLTTDKQRPDALRFYESLGFVASHEGMKLHLG
jgi:GNAT superfamily N-acetyltransferase